MAPSGSPTTTAIATADRLTASERRTMANSVASPLAMSSQALRLSDIAYRYPSVFPFSRIRSGEVKLLNLNMNMHMNAGWIC